MTRRYRTSLTVRERLFPPSYRCYSWYVPDLIGRWLDRIDSRRARRVEDPASVPLIAIAADRVAEVLLAAVASLLLILGASVLLIAIAAVACVIS